MTTVLALGSRLRAMRPLQQDALLAAVLTAAMLVEEGIQLEHSRHGALTVVLVVVIGATLVCRRQAPAAATAGALIALGFFIRVAETPDWTVPLLVVAIEFFTVGESDYSRPRLLVTGGLLLAGLLVIVAIDPQDAHIGGLALVANTALFGLLPLAVGRALRNRRMLARELRARTAQLERDRDERMRQAAVDERTRIARELHDVVAHDVSVMVIQAQGAQRVAAVDPFAAKEALEAVESSGRDALREMRAMTGVVRDSDAELEGSSPGLAQLPVLADRARAAGLAVELQVSPELPALPLGLDLIAYRVVQEALTNAIKHAGRARASVSVQCSERVLELEVSDDGSGDAIADTTGAGHGLVGMRERLALYAGELEAGPTPAGGFRVRAKIPLDAAAGLSEPRPLPESQVIRAPSRRLNTHSTRLVDLGLALGVAAIASANLLLSSHRHGAMALNVLVAVLMGAVALLWRKQALLFATATMALAVVSTAWLTDCAPFRRDTSWSCRRMPWPRTRICLWARGSGGSHCRRVRRESRRSTADDHRGSCVPDRAAGVHVRRRSCASWRSCARRRASARNSPTGGRTRTSGASGGRRRAHQDRARAAHVIAATSARWCSRRRRRNCSTWIRWPPTRRWRR